MRARSSVGECPAILGRFDVGGIAGRQDRAMVGWLHGVEKLHHRGGAGHQAQRLCGRRNHSIDDQGLWSVTP